MSSVPATDMSTAVLEPPGPMEPTRTFRFPSGDGTELYGEVFVSSPCRAVCLIVHGYGEHCGRYREVAHVLVSQGISCVSYDMRGHGRADGQRGHIESFADYLDDLDAAWEEVEKLRGELSLGEDVPRFLIGHSNGGLIVLRTLADPMRKPAGVTAAVLSSPFLGIEIKVSKPVHLAAQVASKWMPALTFPNRLQPENLSSDATKQAERRADTLCHDVASARWYTETLVAQAYLADYVARVDVPTIWLVSEHDRVVNAPTSRVLQARLTAPSTYHGFPDMEHELFNEQDRARIFGLLQLSLAGYIPPR